MKIKLLFLVGIGFVSLSLMAQNPVYMYNKGLMSVVGLGIDPDYDSANNKTILYINGDFVAGGGVDAGGNPIVCNVFLKGSQTVLTGDFIHDVNLTTKAYPAKPSNVFTWTATDYENKYTSYGSRFVFRGTKPQSIRLANNLVYGTSYNPSLKGTNFIDFPDIVIDNQNHVTMVPELAAQAHNLFFTKGRFILDSRRAIASDFKDGNGGNITTDPTLHSTATSSMLAHFMLYKTSINTTQIGRILTKNSGFNNVTNKEMFGAVQVNLAADDPAVANANERKGRSLIGMGSPFKEMRSDYFFWNWILIPTGESIIGQTVPGNSMTDPEYVLKAGKAFVFGVDLRGTDPAKYEFDIHPKYKNKNILFADRFGAAGDNGKYSFSRFGPLFNKTTNIYQTQTANPANLLARANVTDAAYTQEILNNDNITLPLVAGYNYFSNPFTVPLDLSDLINTKPGDPLPSDWGSGLITGDGSVPNRVLTNKVWILDPRSKGSGTYDMFGSMDPGNKWVSVTATYRVMKAVAGTATNLYDSGTGTALGSGSNNFIAPLQMFVLYATPAAVSKNITIPLSKRNIQRNALFIRSTPASKYELKDDFLFEVFDTKTTTADRVAVAIRTPQEVMTDGEYAPTKKLISFVNVGENTPVQTETVEGGVKQTEMSTLFTKDDEGNALESSILGVPLTSDTHSVTLYMVPSATAQEIKMKASRLASADRVVGITLVDKVSKKEYDLWGDKQHTLASKPTDPVDRFTLRFKFATSGIEDGGGAESKNITSYYANGTLTVAGFEDADFGSVISVFDIQGRRVAQAKVDGASVDIREAFFTGAYIVKVVGNKSYAAKFLVK